MAYQQLVAPDLTTTGRVGWCLAFAEDAYDATVYTLATATMGWKATAFPHPGEQPPSEVSVPVWFTYYEQGVNFGHVAISVPGRGVLSSPWKQDGTQVWFDSVEQCRRVMGCQAYLGWSEDIAYKQIVKEMPPMSATDQQIDETINQLNILAFGVGASDATFKDQRPLFHNNYVEATLTVLHNYLAADNAAYKNQNGQFEKVEVYRKVN